MVIWILNYHGTRHLKSEPFNYPTNLHDLNTELVRYSDPHCIWMTLKKALMLGSFWPRLDFYQLCQPNQESLSFRLIKIVNGSSDQSLKFWYSNHLNTGLVWYSNGRFVNSCQMVWYSNGNLKTGLKKPVYGPKCTIFEWLPSHVTLLFDYQTPSLSGIQINSISGVWYSDGYCIFHFDSLTQTHC